MRGALTGILLAAFLVAGCSTGSEFVPPEGTTFAYESSDGDEVTYTYDGRFETAGQTWYRFRQVNAEPYPLDAMTYLSVQSGGLAYARDSSGRWVDDFAKPFMEWDHEPGVYSVKGPVYDYRVKLQADGPERVVEVQTWDDDVLLNKGVVHYNEGDFVPRHVERWDVRQPDGSWRSHGWLRLVEE